MTIEYLDLLLVLVLLLNLYILTTTQLQAVVYAVAMQGMVLAFAYPLAHMGTEIGGHTADSVDVWGILRLVILTVVMAVVRGGVIPWLLLKAMRDADVRGNVVSSIGIVPGLLFGAVGTMLSLAFAGGLPLHEDHTSNLVVPAAMATVFVGFVILTTRLRALTQVLGYIVLENGIFIFGLLLVNAIPFLVECGVLLDLFVGVFVMGIIINHVSRAFGDMDLVELKTLEE